MSEDRGLAPGAICPCSVNLGAHTATESMQVPSCVYIQDNVIPHP